MMDINKALAVMEILDDGTNREKIRKTKEVLELRKMMADPVKVKEVAFYLLMSRAAPLFVNGKDFSKIKRPSYLKIK